VYILLSANERGGTRCLNQIFTPSNLSLQVDSGLNLSLVLATRGGLNAQYFRDRMLTAAVIDRIDKTIDFSFGRAAPPGTGGAVPADSFSVRWRGLVKPTLDSLYTFRAITSPAVGIEGGISRLRYIKTGNEIMLATHVERNARGHLVPARLTVIRGAAGSSAAVHASGADVSPALPLFDSPLAAGSLASGSNESTLLLDASAPDSTGLLSLRGIAVDPDGDVTTSDTEMGSISNYYAGRIARLESDLNTAPGAAATYQVSSVPTAVLGRDAHWVRTSGTLKLTLTPPTTLAAGVSSSDTSFSLVDAAAADVRVGTFLQVRMTESRLCTPAARAY
jgi:hypothetical protein